MKAFTYIITTRDRPDSVLNCIPTLGKAHASAFPEYQSKCFIIDDSTDIANSKKMKSYLASAQQEKNLAVYIIGKSFQSKMLSRLSSTLMPKANYINKTFRELGGGNWDHAGSSNFARLFSYSLLPLDEKILFLDDDIIFDDHSCSNHFIRINGASAILQLYNSVVESDETLSGTTYLGRTDLSVLEHIFFLLIQLKNTTKDIDNNLNLMAGFPELLPIHVTLSERDDDPSLPKGPGEISGAVLAVNNVSLTSHGMINYYNEDWIWILLHGKKNKKIYKSSIPLLHCPPSQKKITFDFIKYQEVGEIIYKSMASAIEEAPQNAICLDWFQKNYKISHLENAVTDHLLSVDYLIQKSLIALDELNIDRVKKDFLRVQIQRSLDFVSDINKYIRELELTNLYND